LFTKEAAMTKLLSAVLASLIATAAFGQLATHRPTFEVATIRIYPWGQAVPPEAQGLSMSENGIRATHVALRGCLQWAYDIVDVSGPEWITEESYDIVAKASGPVSPDELHQMFQALLEDRFKLKLHRETKNSQVGVLLVGKGGVKNLNAVENADAMELKRTDGRLELKNVSMARLASAMGSPLGNMPLEKVIDGTGIAGMYDVTLDLKNFDPRDPAFGSYGEMRDALFSYASAILEKQYGLKLERRSMPLEILVVDGGNRVPIEN
jgi:uncharacterized protein (TIGR03435 family)